MSINIGLVDTVGDLVIVRWDNVTHCEEVRTADDHAPDGRRFLRTRVWFVSGKCVEVQERVADIHEAAGLRVRSGSPAPLPEWEQVGALR